MAFDLEDYKRRTEALKTDDIDFDAFRATPLDEAALRCLRYMHDVEFHTVCYLRDLLLTPAHGDAEVTSFLSFWVYEEYWHGEAIAAVLAAHEQPSGLERVAELRARLGFRDRVRPWLMMLGGWVGKEDFVATHMTWGAINEWTTQAGYSLLARKANHPVLTELLRRIMRQEGRHIDFYATQAQRRLESSARAQKMTRSALKRFWQPVGSGVMARAETEFMTEYLMGDEVGYEAARRIDRRVDRLPGLEGLFLMTRAVGAPPVVAAATDPAQAPDPAQTPASDISSDGPPVQRKQVSHAA